MLDLKALLQVPYVEPITGFDISPDGRNVAFSWNRTGQWEIYEISLTGHRPARKITHGPGGKFGPKYSPDGTRLACGCEDGVVTLWRLGRAPRAPALSQFSTALPWLRSYNPRPMRSWSANSCAANPANAPSPAASRTVIPIKASDDQRRGRRMASTTEKTSPAIAPKAKPAAMEFF